LSNESSAKAEAPTDAFLRMVKQKEEEAMALTKPKPVPNPMAEENLRLEVIHHGDKDEMEMRHRYYSLKGHSRCRDCGAPIDPIVSKNLAHNPHSNPGLPVVPNGYPADTHISHRGFDGADRIAGLLMEGLTRLNEGQPDIVIRTFFIARGYVNKAQEYLAAVKMMADGNAIYEKWKQSHASEKQGGVTK
jgi:hypothetical protein